MKILLIGPLPPPITGNSIINDKIINDFQKYHKDITMDFINVGVPSFDNQFGKFNIKKLLIYLSQYKSIYKVFNIDVVYISLGHTFFGIMKYLPFILLSKISRKQLIVHVHTDYLWLLYKNSSKNKRTILKTILGLIDKGIVLSPILKRNLLPFMRDEKIYELPNFISESLLEHDIDNTILKKEKQPLKILFLSNLIKEKGIIDFLEAMLILEKNNIDFEVHIAGDIPIFMKQEIEGCFGKLKHVLYYHGVVKGNQKKDLFLLSNIFVFPTLREAQPLVLLEAMATANIILSTNVGGISDIFVSNKNGFTIDINNPEQIIDKIIEIQNDMTLYRDMLKENYKEVKQKYTEKRFFDSLYKIIKDRIVEK